MAKAEIGNEVGFEEKIYDIKERTFGFFRRIVRLYSDLVSNGGAGRVLAQQLLRSGTSIGANVEEADAGQSKADFVSKMTISLKEARVTLYWLRLFEAELIADSKVLQPLIQEGRELTAILTTIVRKSRNE